MNAGHPIHPVDRLSEHEKCRIYFRRVVDLAAVEGLLPVDRQTPVGCFAFSDAYEEGRSLDEKLHEDLAQFQKDYPDLVMNRHALLDRQYQGAIGRYQQSSATEKREDLIRIGATYRVWPTCVSFVLTYPWDLAGNGKPVRFRHDLPDFTKRRIRRILEDKGIGFGSDLFDFREYP